MTQGTSVDQQQAEPKVITAEEATAEVLRFQQAAYGVAVNSHLAGILEVADAIGNTTRMVSITMCTVPKIVGVKIGGGRALCTNNPLYGRISKIQVASGPTGFVWSSVVNKQREREEHPEAGFFIAQARLWKAFIDGSPLYMHNGYRVVDKMTGEIAYDHAKRGTLYLPVMVQSWGEPTYFLSSPNGTSTDELILDDEVVGLDGEEKRSLRDWLYWKPERPRGGTQDLDKPREYIGVNWCNVTAFRGMEKGMELHFID